MDVSCTRCGTEYEFDDALISERGTNVRCTQCGYQFKVFPPKLATVGPDEWIVLTGLGRKIVFRSLRELQNGIVKGDVAREDLLARGSKPPRPLGSIAELDPLFVVKSAPERQPSTLTGVAPPVTGGTRDSSNAERSESQLAPQEPQTYSGVAPPPNVPAAVQQTPPAQNSLSRAGRSGTVLGLGGISMIPVASLPPETHPHTSANESTEHTASLVEVHGIHAKPPPPMRATATTAELGSAAQRSAATGLDTAGASKPDLPEKVDAEPAEPEPNPIAALVPPALIPPAPLIPPALAPSAPLIPPALAPSAPLIPPALIPPALAPSAPLESSRTASTEEPPIDTDAGDAARTVPLVPAAPLPVPEPLIEEKLAAPPDGSAPLARVHLQHRLVPAVTSEPPTVKLPGDPAAQRPSAKTSVAPCSEPDLNSTRLMELPAVIRDSGKHENVPGDEHREQAQPGAAAATQAEVGSDEHSLERTRRVRPKPRANQTTAAAPTKTHGKPESPPQPKRGLPLGRIALTVGLLALSAYAGMHIVGAHLQNQKQRAKQHTASSVRPTPADGAKSVEAALDRGDDEGAQKLLAGSTAESTDPSIHRALAARAAIQACDKIWWRVQLVGKDSGEPYAQSKQRLAECLERANRALLEANAGNEASESLIAASLDGRRMQGDKSEPNEPRVLELLRHPSSKELRYTSAVLGWIKTGVPEPAVLTALRESRATPVDLGARSVALVVALVQIGHFDEARQELKALQSQSPPHPLANEMTGYLERAERSQAENADAGAPAIDSTDAGVLAAASASAGKPTEVAEDDPDKDLYAGDFRLRLTRANECLSRNELTRAQKLLRSVLSQRPNDTEAITAMGDVHRRRGEGGQARQMYDKALAINGNYLPAMIGSADIRWKSGDRAGAVALYRRVLERVGDTPGYGQVAAARIREAEGASKDQP